MANSEIINEIVSMVANTMHYMLPIIGILSGILLVITLLLSVTIGSVKRIRL